MHEIQLLNAVPTSQTYRTSHIAEVHVAVK